MHRYDRVLVFGHDDALLETRSWVLEREGFQVWRARDLAAAVETMVAQQIDAMILCQTLSAEERWNAMTLAGELRPEMKILVMESEFARLPEGKQAAVLETVANTRDLIAAVERMTGRGGSVGAQG